LPLNLRAGRVDDELVLRFMDGELDLHAIFYADQGLRFNPDRRLAV
jgi:hypothetical protein